MLGADHRNSLIANGKAPEEAPFSFLDLHFRGRNGLSKNKMSQVFLEGRMTDADAKMFAMGAAYERFMGRWSRLLAPVYVGFSGAGNGDRVLDVGAGTGSL